MRLQVRSGGIYYCFDRSNIVSFGEFRWIARQIMRFHFGKHASISCCLFLRLYFFIFPLSSRTRFGKRTGVSLHPRIKRGVLQLALVITRSTKMFDPQKSTVQRSYIQGWLNQQWDLEVLQSSLVYKMGTKIANWTQTLRGIQRPLSGSDGQWKADHLSPISLLSFATSIGLCSENLNMLE